MNNENMNGSASKIVFNIVDKNGQSLIPPLEYQGYAGNSFSIEIPNLNGYIIQGISGNQSAISYLNNSALEINQNVDYPANLGSVVAINGNIITGSYGRGILTYNLICVPMNQGGSQNMNSQYQQQPQYQQPAPKQKKSHWFRWVVIALLLIIIACIFGLYNAGKNAQTQVKQDKPVIVKNYNNKPSQNNQGTNASGQAQAAIDNAKQEIEQHIDSNNANTVQQITNAIQDGFTSILLKIQNLF